MATSVNQKLRLATNTISLTRDGPNAYFTDIPPNLTDQLRAPEWQPAPHGSGVRAVLQHKPLLRQVASAGRGKTVHVCAAGLAPVVVRHLERAGAPVKLRDPWSTPIPTPNLAMAGRAVADAGLLAAIQHHSHLLVRHGPGVYMANVAEMVALAWPTLRIAIAVARVDDARDIADSLRAAGVTTGLATHRHTAADESRVVVATFGQLGRASVGAHDLDILLLADAVEALGARSREVLDPGYWPGSVRVPHVVGMVPASRRLAGADKIGLMELCGPFTYELPEVGIVSRPVSVVMTTIRGGRFSAPRKSVTPSGSDHPGPKGQGFSAPRIASEPADINNGLDLSTVDPHFSAPRLSALVRAGIRHHPIRNRRITRLARMLASGDYAALAADFPIIATVNDLPLAAAVMVVVEGPEQAHDLSSRLPGWPLLGLPSKGTGLNSQFAAPGGQIATFDAIRDLPFLDADVVIRADGGTGALPLSPSALTMPSGWARRSLLIVDCADQHHPELRRRSRARQLAYRVLGWPQVGQDEVDVALDFIIDQVRP